MLVRQFVSNRALLGLLVAYTTLMWMLDYAGGDVWFAHFLYSLEGQQWLLRDHWLTQTVLHEGARSLNYILVLAVLLTTLYYGLQATRYPTKARAYAALSLSLATSFFIVAYLKTITNVACPWDLLAFGGSEPYIHYLQIKPSFLPYHRCFPAGHASVGFAWVALYFFFEKTAPTWRYSGLALGLVAGSVLGMAQQLRGAHFLSHDLTTLLLCLGCARFCFMLFFKTETSWVAHSS
ncbi:MAG: phosphatase PAP2 family protein [Alishewanella sp.]|nr:phosphatase PAP2 family protein [Alishewanella sp.]